MRRIWLAKLQRDESLCFDLAKNVLKLKSKPSGLRDLKFNRLLVKTKQMNLIDLHVFCNASETDFGVCIHVVAQNKQGRRREFLPTAKAQVALLKAQSNPHLEICTALLHSKLIKSVSKSLSQMNLQIKGQYAYTDTISVDLASS